MSNYPVHDRLVVLSGEDIYKTARWWKAVVQYQVDNSDYQETAIYLWHNEDDSWTRKNKYVIKTSSAWEEDKEVISTLWTAETGDGSSDIDSPEELPVSDYYSVSHGTTVFNNEEWWKAIVRIKAKGDYETSEVIVYLWQQSDDEWKCRQKYAIKDLDDWDEEASLISQFVEANHRPASDNDQDGSGSERDTTSDPILDSLEGELAMSKEEEHVSEQIRS